MRLVRRIRGVLGTSVIWAVTWTTAVFPVFAILLRNMLPPASWLPDVALLAVRWGLLGAGTGATFALLLLAFERRSTLAKFAITRAALWGSVAGAGYASVTIARFLAQIGRAPSEVGTSIVVGAVLGGCSAAMNLALAKRAARTFHRPTQGEVASPTI